MTTSAPLLRPRPAAILIILSGCALVLWGSAFSAPTAARETVLRYRLAAPAGYSKEDLATVRDRTVQRGFRSVQGIVTLADLANPDQGIVIPSESAPIKPALAAAESKLLQINRSGVLPPGMRLERIGEPYNPLGFNLLGNAAQALLLVLLLWTRRGDRRHVA